MYVSETYTFHPNKTLTGIIPAAFTKKWHFRVMATCTDYESYTSITTIQLKELVLVFLLGFWHAKPFHHRFFPTGTSIITPTRFLILYRI